MSKKNGLGTWYRRASGALLDLLVSPHVIGEIPTPLHSHADASSAANASASSPRGNPQRPICYVLQQYSRSNVVLMDSEAQRQNLHAPLAAMDSYLLNEDASIIFLQRQPQNSAFHHQYLYPPRLVRLIDAIEQNANLDVDLVPVTILWGRTPDKEDSWFKLLTADSWDTPNALRQLLNIGVHGRNTYVQFHEPMSLL